MKKYDCKFYNVGAGECQQCKNQADIIYKSVVIIDDRTKEYILCQKCASKLKAKIEEKNAEQKEELPIEQGKSPTVKTKNISKKKMRKVKAAILGVVIFFTVVFVASVIAILTDDSDSTKTDSGSNSGITVENRINNNGRIIADNDYFVARFIEAKSIPNLDGCFNVYIHIENKSDSECIYLLEDCYVDDVAANFSGSGVPQKALSGKKVNGVFCIFSDVKIEDARKFEFKIECLDSNYNRIKVSDMITLNMK